MRCLRLASLTAAALGAACSIPTVVEPVPRAAESTPTEAARAVTASVVPAPVAVPAPANAPPSAEAPPAAPPLPPSEYAAAAATARSRAGPGWRAREEPPLLLIHSEGVPAPSVDAVVLLLSRLVPAWTTEWPAVGDPPALLLLRLCDGADEFRRYGGASGSLGSFSAGEGETVAYFDCAAKGDTPGFVAAATLLQYLHRALGGRSVAPWFVHGVACSVERARLTHDGRVRLERRPFRARQLRDRAETRPPVPMARFLRMTRQEFAGPEVGDHFEQAAALVAFLRETRGVGAGRLRAYWDAVRAAARGDGGDGERTWEEALAAALAAAFPLDEPAPMAALEGEFLDWLRR